MLPGLASVKQSIDAAMRTALWGVVGAGAAVVTAGFLCAALFIWIDDRQGAIAACLVLGGVFMLMAIISMIAMVMIRKRQAELAALRAQSAAAWRDRSLIAAGLEVGRALGYTRVGPLLLLGAFVIGLALSRPRRDGSPDRDAGRP